MPDLHQTAPAAVQELDAEASEFISRLRMLHLRIEELRKAELELWDMICQD